MRNSIHLVAVVEQLCDIQSDVVTESGCIFSVDPELRGIHQRLCIVRNSFQSEINAAYSMKRVKDITSTPHVLAIFGQPRLSQLPNSRNCDNANVNLPLRLKAHLIAKLDLRHQSINSFTRHIGSGRKKALQESKAAPSTRLSESCPCTLSSKPVSSSPSTASALIHLIDQPK